MPSGPVERQISDRIRNELQTQFPRVSALNAAVRTWDWLLSDQEKESLGGNWESFAEHYQRLGTVGIWMQLKRVSQPRAIVELARELGFLHESKARRLLRELGENESLPSAEPLDRPVWDNETGELRLRGEVIRKVRLNRNPTNIQRILDAFHEEGWPSRIDSPLPGGVDPKKLQEAVRTLNQSLTAIEFHVQEGGQAVRWTHLKPR